MTSKSTVLDRYFCETATLRRYLMNHGVALTNAELYSSLLDSVTVANECSSKPIQEKFSSDTAFSTRDLILHAVDHLCALKLPSVLSYGYCFSWEGSKKQCIAGTRLLAKYINTIVVYLQSTPWEMLHRAIGDDVMFYLLVRTSLFVLVERGCYVQLTGPPLNEISKEARRCHNKCKDGTKPECYRNQAGKNPLFKNDQRGSTDLITISGIRGGQKRKLHMENLTNKKRKLNRSNRDNRSGNGKVLVMDECKRKYKRNATDTQSKQPTGECKTTNSLNRRGARRHVFIQRNKMLYAKVLKDGFHKKFILNEIPSSNLGVWKLMNAVFNFSSEKYKIKRIPHHLLGVKNLFLIVIKNFKICKLNKLLNFYCPVAKWIKGWRKATNEQTAPTKMTFTEKVRYKFAVKSYVEPQKVYNFVRAVLNKVIPDLLWGCPQNKKNFLKSLLTFLMLGRYEKILLNNIMTGIKLSSFDWLFGKDGSSHKHAQYSLKQHDTVSNVFLWMFNGFVVPLLRSCFYITETGCHKNKLFYYRKQTWRVILHEGLKPVIGHVYQPVSLAFVDEKLKNKDCLGVFDVRLIPGQNKLRPIANMSRCFHETENKKNLLVKTILKNVHLSLQHEIEKNPSIYGATVSNSTEVYHRWERFVRHVKSRHEVLPPFYFASLDISRCFDTLPHDQLLNYLPEVLSADSYLIRTFTRLKCAQNGKLSFKLCRIATEGTDCDNFVDFIRHRQRSGLLTGRNMVFIDKVYRWTESREKLIDLVSKHIKCSIGRVGDNFVIQDTGVPQGSILATMLNNLHYGKMEKEYFTQFNSPNCLLMRWVDDYILVSTSKHLAERFVLTMHQSMSSFGCHVNRKKTLLNFHQRLFKCDLACVHGNWFPWCGYFINTQTLEFSYNYVQYIGENIQDGMNIQCGASPGLKLRQKLIQTTTVKASALVVDSVINSRHTVHKNIYHLFRFIAVKFIAHIRKASKAGRFKLRIPFLLRLIQDLPATFLRSCRNSLHRRRLHAKRLNSSLVNSDESTTSSPSLKRQKLIVEPDLARFLCFQAFVDTLRQKQTLYGRLVMLLIRELKDLKHFRSDVDLNLLKKQSAMFDMIRT